MPEADAVNAYLALAVGGCGRRPALHEHQGPGLAESLTDVAGMFRHEAVFAAEKVVDTVRTVAPQLLSTLRPTRSS